ncbi:unnamed protein product, partial [Prorocentrum cordatum]
APSFVGIGRCNHADVCWVCVLRLRALSQDYRCPVCKEELEDVVITSDASRFPSPARLAELPRDPSLAVRFADEGIQKEVMRLFEYRCRVQKCASSSCAFGSLRELENHLWHAHWLQFCRTCLHGRAAFLCEQCVFSSKDLGQHVREGSGVLAAGGAPPVPPHPLCQFCDRRTFVVVGRHMHERHHLCQICAQMGRRNEFYANVRCLAAHYAEDHYVCAHPNCSHNGHRITAFATEEDLQLHMLKEHRDMTHGSDRERKELMQRALLVGQRSYAEERAAAQSSGGGKGGGKGGKGASGTNEGFEIRFAWPSRQSRASLGNSEEEDFARELDEREAARRYPERDALQDEAEERGGLGELGPQGDGEAEVPEEADEEGDAGSDGEEEGVPQERRAGEHAGQPESAGELDPAVEALPLEVTVAAVGRQPGMRCCLDALRAVLRALRAGDGADDGTPAARPELHAAVARLTLLDLESLEKVRKDLDSGARSEECDWEPLERVLSLRPLFFRLLRSSRGGGGAPRGKIGPSVRGGAPRGELVAGSRRSSVAAG